MTMPSYHVVIAGGGPAGLSAALALGRGRKRVLLCDAPPRRNAAAEHVHNFVTRDGTPPEEFRETARAQLRAYPNVAIVDARVEGVAGDIDAFEVQLASGRVSAHRVLLCTGMVDELPDIDGIARFWGHAVFACPYCHGWEVQDRRFVHLAASPEALDFAAFLRGWTGHVTTLTNGAFEVEASMRERLSRAGVQIDERRVARLAGTDRLERIEFTSDGSIPADALVMHPHQRQVDLVQAMSVALDEKGYVRTDESRLTSIPGVYAAGDLVTPFQSAIFAAAAGTHAAASLNRELTIQLATAGLLE